MQKILKNFVLNLLEKDLEIYQKYIYFSYWILFLLNILTKKSQKLVNLNTYWK